MLRKGIGSTLGELLGKDITAISVHCPGLVSAYNRPMDIDLSSRVTHHFGGGVYAKEMRLHKDEVFTQHVHKYDHLSVLAEGCVAVEVDGETEIYGAPACILIKAGAQHRIIGMMNSTWYCIHATDETDPDLIDQSTAG